MQSRDSAVLKVQHRSDSDAWRYWEQSLVPREKRQVQFVAEAHGSSSPAERSMHSSQAMTQAFPALTRALKPAPLSRKPAPLSRRCKTAAD